MRVLYRSSAFRRRRFSRSEAACGLGFTESTPRCAVVHLRCVKVAEARQPYNWLNKSAFAIPSSGQIAAGDVFGNTGRGSVRAPGPVNFDFSLMKNFQVGENRRLQFRCEFFNVMNTPFFGGDGYVNVNVSSPTFGQIAQAGDPRVIQLGLNFIF
jgi:hypothetical protein